MSWFGGTGRQVYTTLCSNLLSVAYGSSVGWASSAIPFLQSNETILLGGPLSKEDSSWIQSIFTIGGLLGSFFYGWVTDRIGRKRSLISAAVLQIFSWILIGFAQNGLHVGVSRLCAGIAGGGLYILIPLFISEIADDSIRGRLGSVFVFASGSGILFAYTCGTFFKYSTLPYIYTPLSILFLVGAMFHPDSAHYLIKKKKIDEAERSIRFFRNIQADKSNDDDNAPTDQLKIEFESLKSLLSEHSSGNSVTVKDFLTKPAIKVFIIGVGLMFLEQFTGVFALLFFVATIFKNSGSSLSPDASSIIVGIIQLGGAYCSTSLVDKLGRRFLISLSALGISSGMLVFAIYSYLNDQGHVPSYLNWIPLVSFSFVMFIANFGVLTLPFLVMSELMITLPHIKSYIYTLCLSLSWIFAFVIMKYLDSLIELLGIGGLMLIFSINSLIGGLFVMFYVPETKEKSFQEILEILQK